MIVAIFRWFFPHRPVVTDEYRQMLEQRQAQRRRDHEMADQKNRELYDRLASLRVETELAKRLARDRLGGFGGNGQ